MVAKLSIYVPDDLWAAAQRLTGQENASQLVQSGLKRLIGVDEAPSFAEDVSREVGLGRIRETKRAEAREAYTEGYKVGVKIAAAIPWELLDVLADVEFDFTRVDSHPSAHNIWEGEQFSDLGETWAERLQELVVELARETGPWGGKLHQQAMRQAMRDVWTAVLADDDPTDPEQS